MEIAVRFGALVDIHCRCRMKIQVDFLSFEPTIGPVITGAKLAVSMFVTERGISRIFR